MSQSHKQPLNTNLRPHTHDGCGDFLFFFFTMLLLKVLFGSQHAGPSTRETPRQQQQYPPMSSTQPAPPKQRTTTYKLPAILQARLAGSLSRSGAPPQETRATGGGAKDARKQNVPTSRTPPQDRSSQKRQSTSERSFPPYFLPFLQTRLRLSTDQLDSLFIVLRMYVCKTFQQK